MMNTVQLNSQGRNYLSNNEYEIEYGRPGLKQGTKLSEFDGYSICFIEHLNLRAVGMH